MIVTTEGMANAAVDDASPPVGAADATLTDAPSSLDDFEATRPATAPATAPPSSAMSRKATSQAREGPTCRTAGCTGGAGSGDAGTSGGLVIDKQPEQLRW